MVSTELRRAAVSFLKERGLSERRSCVLAGVSRSGLRYQAHPRDDSDPVERLREIARPARDLGPRVFSILVGDTKGFQGLYWLIVPILGPMVGGVLGAWFYDAAIASILPRKAPVTAEAEHQAEERVHEAE